MIPPTFPENVDHTYLDRPTKQLVQCHIKFKGMVRLGFTFFSGFVPLEAVCTLS